MLFTVFGSGCDAKRKIQTEINDLRMRVSEQRATLKRSEGESAALGYLGRYNNPHPQFVTELKDRVDSLKKDGAKLAAERELKAASVKKMEDELDAYQSKFPTR